MTLLLFYIFAGLSEESKSDSTTTASAPSEKKVEKTKAELPYAVRYLSASDNQDKNSAENTENTDSSK